jgi:propionyl-CoA carboxylase alpha chain
MIRVAAGEKIPFAQSDVRRDGWAIECRINAEDPFRNFLPSTGRLIRFQPPPTSMHQANTENLFGVRVDTGVQEGGEIPIHYDSMIAKLIVHGRDRNDAIAKMRDALNGFVIRGINSNIPFQSALLAHPDFVAGRFNTGFIAEHFSKGFSAESVSHTDPDFLIALAAFVRRKSRERAASLSGQLPGYDVKVGQTYTVITLDAKGHHGYTQVEVDDVGGRGTAVIKVNDKNYAIESHSRLNDIAIEGTVNGQAFVADLYRLMPYKPPADMSRFVLSPMPGLLVEVAVTQGQKVQAGERVAVIEAMKMENVLFAAQDGVVKSVQATKGDSLSVDQVIVEFV